MKTVLRMAALVAAVVAPLSAAAEKLNVVATTGMIADAARTIGGDRTDVVGLMGPGVDPHAYRQTQSDVRKLARADLVLWNGLYLEAQLEELMARLSARQRVVAVAESVPADRRVAHDDYADRFDPHVWMDPALWVLVVDAVRDALIAADPAGADAYGTRAAAYRADVDALGAYARGVLSSVPTDRRVLITAHDAFNYFGAAYRFEVMGVQGISTESEAGLKRIQDLVDLIVDRRIEAVFVESSVSDRALKALVEGAAAKGQDVAIGGELFSDAMGPDGTYEGRYLGMIDHNVTTIARALGGEAPADGWRAQLAAAE